MKFGMHVTITAMALSLAGAGVLTPIYNGVSELEAQVAALETENARGETVMETFKALKEQRAELEADIAGRQFRLCPNDQSAFNDFESTLLTLVDDAGLDSIRTVRATKPVNSTFRYLAWDLVVQGDALALDKFLVDLEELDWVARVLSLSIDSGEDVRDISLKIAVMLEQEGNA